MDNAKDLRYESGMMGPAGRDMTKTANNNKPSKKENTKVQCRCCVLDTHRQVASKLCPKNPKTMREKKTANAIVSGRKET
jgi:hypothetical protein